MLTILLISLTALYIYQRTIIDNIFQTRYDFRPLNCVYCISFWMGVSITITACYLYGIELNNFIYLSLPLLYRVTQIKLLK